MSPSIPTTVPPTFAVDASAFLRRFGYLTGAGGPATDLADAVRRFQRFHRLPVTGTLDPATAGQMQRSRCALPDPADPLASSTLCAWDRTALTYAFDTDSTDLADSPQRDAVRRALASWTAVCPVAFQEVAVSASPDVRVGWRPVPDADYDLSGSTIAHSDYPPGCDYVTTMPKPVHFDDTEHRWAVGRVDGAFDVESVALHEFGHILGLAHVRVRCRHGAHHRRRGHPPGSSRTTMSRACGRCTRRWLRWSPGTAGWPSMWWVHRPRQCSSSA